MQPILPELTWVSLTRDLPDAQIGAGTLGCIVHVYEDGAGYEVEFFDETDRTISVETVSLTDVAPMSRDDHTDVAPMSRDDHTDVAPMSRDDHAAPRAVA